MTISEMDSNRTPPEYESDELPLCLHSVCLLFVDFILLSFFLGFNLKIALLLLDIMKIRA